MIVISQCQTLPVQKFRTLLQAIRQSLDLLRRLKIHSSGKSVNSDLRADGFQLFDYRLRMFENNRTGYMRSRHRNPGSTADSCNLLVANGFRMNKFHRTIAEAFKAVDCLGKGSCVLKMITHGVELCSNLREFHKCCFGNLSPATGGILRTGYWIKIRFPASAGSFRQTVRDHEQNPLAR